MEYGEEEMSLEDIEKRVVAEMHWYMETHGDSRPTSLFADFYKLIAVAKAAKFLHVTHMETTRNLVEGKDKSQIFVIKVAFQEEYQRAHENILKALAALEKE